MLEPLSANHGEQDVTFDDGIADVVAEVDAKRHIVDVHEHRLETEMRAEPIENPAAGSGGIGATVGNEDIHDGAHHKIATNRSTSVQYASSGGSLAPQLIRVQL